MKLQIFILDEDDKVIIDRRFPIIDGNAPRLDIQDIVDDVLKYQRENKQDEMELEARRLIAQDKQN